MYMGNNRIIKYCTLLFFFTCILSSCDKTNCCSNILNVECRLVRICDSKPFDVKIADRTRHIRFYCVIKNNTDSIVFLPFNSDWSLREDSMYCSRINVFIDSVSVESLLRTNLKWSGIINPRDSVIVEFKIFGRLLKNIGMDEYIDIHKLMDKISFEYTRCADDSVFTKYPIPNIVFIHEDSVKIFADDNDNSAID